MTNLRTSLIKLAHSNPDLRAHLLPLLKQAGSYAEYKKNKEREIENTGKGEVMPKTQWEIRTQMGGVGGKTLSKADNVKLHKSRADDHRRAADHLEDDLANDDSGPEQGGMTQRRQKEKAHEYHTYAADAHEEAAKAHEEGHKNRHSKSKDADDATQEAVGVDKNWADQ